MSTYVLVHGAFHGAWCWDKIVPLLEEKGHKVVTLDLPGQGQDPTPMTEVTFQGYTNRVCEVIDQQEGKVILVGHSMGGLSITQAAEYRPDKIEALVYVTAYLPQNGESLFDLNNGDQDAIPVPAIWAEDQTYVTLDLTKVRESFYGHCSEKDIAEAKDRLGRQSTGPFMTGIQITEANFGRVPRAYIECTDDKTISIGFQRMMYGKTPCQEIISIDTDHSPFLSTPKELVKHLDKLAKVDKLTKN